MSLKEMGKNAKQAATILAQLSQQQKNTALQIIAEQLELQSDKILVENAKDIQLAKENGLSDAIIDRLLLTKERINSIAKDVRHIISLSDPIGQIIDGGILESGTKLERVRVPLGVIGVIYEARPNVTVDVATLCLKTSNAVILRGGKETNYSNKILVKVIQDALEQTGLPKNAVQAITDPDRNFVLELLKLDKYVDMIIPRGGAGLHEFCKQNSTIPVIIGGVGVCHVFVEESAEQDKALAVIDNAKTQRPSTCNTLETLLVQESIATEFLPKLVAHLKHKNVKYHADPTALSILEKQNAEVSIVQEQQLRQEWGSLDLNVVIVKDIQQAIAHITEYGTQHSEAILTSSPRLAHQFVSLVDAAAVYVNASTRFTDGGQFGLGAEVAVSTQKLHARGPMGLEALTTYKWVCSGDYTVRQ
ncbi:glutamate-5-semialdehyde dehydrogenase [Histophilus somni]|uniref:Gamma-glutamyl phosphate reductase n=1 Tax=Histophilus somni (strain 2336) TaxID=228400 RepID=PROA_HISS2|nr:glutamate-5-semialdehyde dehydrogenase [Histophilus somni]B0USH2.1 RecName: Full=Gamma-glutamyl phosphate reductase; Short=GPR; AltName: Full=Glutamate-5-semialdehyde dehydrogenase; AltName: Full=Glutamyl-gamma-semialdehyde dehydrogenase; Short=GSA dehydrogenase [Histophilus somni 2336]ACA32400.1 gamma-glutamyl phosphate reductase [Histophilus somni 2336]QQF86499.1 glutamate-5-semialdehyde dehydrogenase [Histophilus somni]QQJ89697.1 glutamate-5-semialdehyde dehydrogenase [Histophilus somni]